MNQEEEEEFIESEPSTFMMPQCKRGKGKVSGVLGIREMYKYYLSLKDKKKDDIVDYKTFAMITKKCNEEAVNQIVNHSQEFHLPYRLGKLQVSKFERNFNPARKNKWKVDYKRSRESGVLVYHDSPFIYKWAWKKNRAVVINKSSYKFRAARTANRLITKALKNKVDYFC